METTARSWRGNMRDEAAFWVVRLSDPSCSEADRAAFEAWRSADPRREVAFEREQAAWQVMDRLRALRPAGGQPDPDLLAPAKHDIKPKAWLLRPRWAVAASILAAVSIVGALAFDLAGTQAYATGIGERRVVVLADGSRVELNTNSEIVVHYSGGARNVRLVRGEAMFKVAKGDRPFVVTADKTQLRASAAEMEVRLLPVGFQVRVKDGQVAVASPVLSQARGGVQPAVLNPDVEAFYSRAGANVHQISSAEIERSLAWRQGDVAFNGQSLSEAVEEFNRYNVNQLVITDDSIASIRLAGYFQNNDLPGFVRALTHAFPIRAAQADDGSIYLSRAG